MSLNNKAGYTAIQSRTVGQEQLCENRSEFKNVTDGPTYRPTDTARCRVACPRLKIIGSLKSVLCIQILKRIMSTSFALYPSFHPRCRPRAFCRKFRQQRRAGSHIETAVDELETEIAPEPYEFQTAAND